jgi:hypothetical protein
MGITRRRFLGYTTGVVTAGLRGLPGLPLDLTGRRFVLLDLNERCCPSESVAGYEFALTSAGAQWMRADARWVSARRCTVLIVPAAVEIPPPAVRAIMSCLQAGASVILESGAGFVADREFRTHRVVLRDYLQVHIEEPLDLWRDNSSQRIPYVDYAWPRPAQVRDFSRVVPLGRQAGEVIARVDGLPVALKRSSGRGRLIFLGSPLGPALWAGDAEARRWLLDCLRTAGGERA